MYRLFTFFFFFKVELRRVIQTVTSGNKIYFYGVLNLSFTSGSIYGIRHYLGLQVNQGTQWETKKMALVTQNSIFFNDFLKLFSTLRFGITPFLPVTLILAIPLSDFSLIFCTILVSDS